MNKGRAADAERDAGMKNLSRKEALEILNDIKVKIKIPKAAVMQDKRNAALDMAIEALKCSETPKSSEQTVEATQPDHIAESDIKVSISCAHENDLVFRKAAIEALARMMPRSYTPDGSHPADEEIFRAQEVFADCIEALEILPSAQPEIIRCKDCKYNVSSHKCLHPESFFLVPDDDFYCGYAERRTDEQTKKGCHYRNIQRIGSDC